MGNLVGYIKEVALERKTCKLEGTMAKTRKQGKKKKHIVVDISQIRWDIYSCVGEKKLLKQIMKFLVVKSKQVS